MALLLLCLLVVLLWCCLLVKHASVGACCFTTTPTLRSCTSMLSTVLALPSELPMQHAKFYCAYPDLSFSSGTKIGYFCCLFCAYDWPTIANIDPSSSVACIAAFNS